MERFWKHLIQLNVRGVVFAAALLLVCVLLWWGRQTMEAAERRLSMLPDSVFHPTEQAAPEENTPWIPADVLAEEAGKNPFTSKTLNARREAFRLQQEEEARRKAEEEARRKAEEEARRKAAEEAARKKAAEEAAKQKAAAEAAKQKAQPPPPPPKRKITLTYQGLLVRTDGSRFALLQKDQQPAVYYAPGAGLEWVTLQRITRDTLELKINDQVITLQRNVPHTLQEP
jgi:type IV secretory pathway VirB10-like protein